MAAALNRNMMDFIVSDRADARVCLCEHCKHISAVPEQCLFVHARVHARGLRQVPPSV